MTQKTLLTIIIPCYNAERYIERCTASLGELRKHDVSIIFINDGSIDSTEKMLELWIENRPNAKLITKENGGYCTAINMGLDFCDSEYVMFLGVDDEIMAEGIHNVCKHLYDNSPDILAFSTNKVYDDEPSNLTYERDPITEYHREGCFEMDLFTLCQKNNDDTRILFTRDTSRCFKRSVIGDLRYFGKTGVSADGCFSTLVACNSHKFEFLNEDCYIWHLHKDSVSAKTKSPAKIKEEADVWKTYFCRLKHSCPSKSVPMPIIDHIRAYKKITGMLCDIGERNNAKVHNKHVRANMKWLLKSDSLLFKHRIFLMFPTIYLMLADVRKKMINRK